MSVIKVTHQVYSSKYSVIKNLRIILENSELLSFDTETRSLYDKHDREEAKIYIKEYENDDRELFNHAHMVSNSSGLSFPEITKTTHFIFGISKSHSKIFICDSYDLELKIWKIISKSKAKFLVHNSLFDFKIMFNRIGLLPPDFEDTSIAVKCLINHVNVWKSKTGLKELMSSYYDPSWTLMNDYEPDNLKEEKFIKYAAIDGAATYYLWELIQNEFKDYKNKYR